METRDQAGPLLQLLSQYGIDEIPFMRHISAPPSARNNALYGAAQAYVQGQGNLPAANTFQQGIPAMPPGFLLQKFDQPNRPALPSVIDTTLVEYGNNPNFAPWKIAAKYCLEIYNKADLKIAHLMAGSFALASKVCFKSEDLNHEADAFAEEVKAEIAKYGPSSAWAANKKREIENFIRQKFYSHLAKADSILGKGNAKPIAVTASNR